jgi:hypothetical protein
LGEIKRLLPLLLGALLVAGSVTPVLADEPPTADAPPAGPDQGFGGADSYRGKSSLTEDACEPINPPSLVAPGDASEKSRLTTQGGGNSNCPAHYLDVRIYYVVDSITGRYDGFYKTVYSNGYCLGPWTATITTVDSVSNKWSASIGFKKEPISGTVGYDVTYTQARSFSFSFPVPAGREGSIWRKDWYHVTNLAIHVLKTGGNYPAPGLRVNGTAWAAQYFKSVHGIALS